MKATTQPQANFIKLILKIRIMSLSRPHENEKKFFIQSFKHLANWYPHLTLDETMKLALSKLDQEQKSYPNYSSLKVWQHPIDKQNVNRI
tara:strand:- start:796 stop:1065 length:270 start_codon:yes stop_codon:yes gene_type:complete